MSATQLDVFRVDESEAKLWLFKTDSLFDAMSKLRGKEPGKYLILSEETRRKQFYVVHKDGNVTFSQDEPG
jgi:hypothetical protein